MVFAGRSEAIPPMPGIASSQTPLLAMTPKRRLAYPAGLRSGYLASFETYMKRDNL